MLRTPPGFRRRRWPAVEVTLTIDPCEANSGLANAEQSMNAWRRLTNSVSSIASPVTFDAGWFRSTAALFDQHVEATEGIEHRGGDLLDRRVLGQVGSDHQRIIREFGRDRAESVGTACHQRHTGAACVQLSSDRLADTTARAGHHGSLAREVERHHSGPGERGDNRRERLENVGLHGDVRPLPPLALLDQFVDELLG